MVLAIGCSAVRYRQEIAMIWPQSAGVYASLGLKVNAHGIDFAHVDYRRENEDGQVVLAVTGNIVNAGSRELPVPQNVRVTLERRQQSRTLSLDLHAQCADLEARPVRRHS